MPPHGSLDDIIGKRAEEFATHIRNAATVADKEEEIRIESEKQLAFIQREAGIKLEGKHEYTVASGRVDSVYSRVIIEYKNPKSPGDRIGPKADSPGSKKVVEQIKKRFYDMRDEHGQPINSLFGVGLDGKYFIFVRFRDEKWQVQEPVEVTRHSSERFLWALFNLGSKGKPLSPKYLASDFGSEGGNTIAIVGIQALYTAIVATANPKAQTFFSQWKILFGEVCGYDVDNPSEKLKKLAEYYQIETKGLKPAELLFAVHTYYALFMKLLASEIVAFFHKLPTPLQKMMTAGTSAKLKREVEDLEAGSIFRHLNISNFLEGDLFAWYTSVWTAPIEQLVRAMAAKLDEYNPGTLSEDPAGTRDLLKKLYQQLFPRSVRHALGEYYTPDWLADHVLNELDYEGDPDKRVLDPACGSGTFLVMTINRVRRWYEENRERCDFDEGGLCRKLLSNVIGFDLNPLAVMAARTNYLIAIRDLIGRVDQVEIPVYLCDSILTPAEYGDLFSGKHGVAKELKTAAARFLVPSEIAGDRQSVAKYAEQLEFCVRNAYTADEFLQRCADESLPITAANIHKDLYNELVKLDKANRNGVWARIIKNSFAPLFIGRVDYVVGNPPWVNWESLPSEYREATKPLWVRYGLFTLKGQAARLGGGKKDLSILFVYLCLDSYLVANGQLGFVITQTLFKTREAGDGFRRFAFQSGGKQIYIAPKRVIDMTELHPFEGATNRTASFVCRFSATEMSWPANYEIWRLKNGVKISEDSEFEFVDRSVTKMNIGAIPMVAGVNNSAWMTAPTKSLAALKKVRGTTPVKAHAGVCTWMNSVFWLKSVIPSKAGRVRISNWHDVGKIKVEPVDAVVEEDLVYPLLRGRDVHRWISNPSTHILLTQDPETRVGIAESVMKRKYRLTLDYLRQYEKLLRKRPGYIKYFDTKKDPFWTIYNVGKYSVSPHRVVFKEFTDFFQCAVPPAEDKPVIADTKLRFIECESTDEAHYLCGFLNSSPAMLFLYSTATWVQTADYQASDISRLALPRYNKAEKSHGEIVRFSKACHAARRKEKLLELRELEAKLDQTVKVLWNLTDTELKACQDALSAFGLFTSEAESPTDDDSEDE
jgi:Eco57I restriction-modification methylase